MSATLKVTQESSLNRAGIMRVALMSLNVITESTALALGLAAVLLAFDLLAWRFVATMFDRERLVAGRPG